MYLHTRHPLRPLGVLVELEKTLKVPKSPCSWRMNLASSLEVRISGYVADANSLMDRETEACRCLLTLGELALSSTDVAAATNSLTKVG